MANIFPNLTQTMNAQTRDGQWKQPLETWRQLHQDSSQPSCSKTLRKYLTSSQRNKTRHTGRHKKVDRVLAGNEAHSLWRQNLSVRAAHPGKEPSAPRGGTEAPSAAPTPADGPRETPGVFKSTEMTLGDTDLSRGGGAGRLRWDTAMSLTYRGCWLPSPAPGRAAEADCVAKRQLTSGSLREILATLHQINPF